MFKRATRTLAFNLFDVHGPETRGERIYFRILEIGILFFSGRYVWMWASYIQRNITETVLPLGVAQYIDISFMFDHDVAFATAGLATVLMGLGFFRVWRPAYGGVFLLFHLQYVSRYCLGEISHSSNLVGMAVLCLALMPWVFTGGAHQRAFAKGALFFFTGVGYTAAALCKLIGTGLNWVDGRHLLMWMMEKKVDTLAESGGVYAANVLQELVLQDYHWGTAFLIVGLLSEAFSFLMWVRPLRYVVTAAVVGLHIGIWLTMNILFLSSTVLLVLMMIPGGAVLDRLRSGPPLDLSVVVPKGQSGRTFS